jgi:hypothetical protein
MAIACRSAPTIEPVRNEAQGSWIRMVRSPMLPYGRRGSGMNLGDQKPAAVDEKTAPSSFLPGTARKLLILAFGVALALGIGFLLVHHQKATSEAPEVLFFRCSLL